MASNVQRHWVRSAAGTALLLLCVAAPAQSDPPVAAGGTNTVRWRRGRRAYDGRVQWHTAPANAVVPKEESTAPGTISLRPQLADPSAMRAPSMIPPTVYVPPRPPAPADKDKPRDDWAMMSVEDILGGIAGDTERDPSGWGWLADQVRGEQTNGVSAARAEIDRGGREGLLSAEGDSRRPMSAGLVHEYPFGSGTGPTGSERAATNSTLDRMSSSGSNGGEWYALRLHRNGPAARADPSQGSGGPVSPGRANPPDAPAGPSPSASAGPAGRAYPGADQAMAGTSSHVPPDADTRPYSRGEEVRGFVPTDPIARAMLRSPGPVAPPSAAATSGVGSYGERGAIFSPGFRSSSVAASPGSLSVGASSIPAYGDAAAIGAGSARGSAFAPTPSGRPFADPASVWAAPVRPSAGSALPLSQPARPGSPLPSALPGGAVDPFLPKPNR